MSGIAGFAGSGAGAIDAAAVADALSFTGVEHVEETREEKRPQGFLGLAVTHETEASRCSPLYEDGRLRILLAGYITGIEGTGFDPARPGDALELCAGLFRSEGTGFARRLNGSWTMAIHDAEEDALHLFCDRTATRHLYYMEKNGALAFASRIEAFTPMGLEPTAKLNRQAFIEFMVFSRLLVSEMWEGVHPVPPATALSFRAGCTERRVFWNLKFAYDRNPASLEENAERMAGALRDAVGRSTAGFERLSLLLSGGLDSRAIMACMPEDTVCYTMYSRRNLELRVAARTARVHGCRHVPLQVGPHHYLEILPGAARTCEGAYRYCDAHFGADYGAVSSIYGPW